MTPEEERVAEWEKATQQLHLVGRCADDWAGYRPLPQREPIPREPPGIAFGTYSRMLKVWT